jgi:hypothetical protein
MKQARISSFAVANGNVNRDSGMIMGVSVITAGVVRGHGMFADETTIAQVYGLMKEMGTVKVKADHYSGFDKIVGALVNPTIDGDRVRADFQLIQAHEMYPVILELAEKQPETFGFSIAFSGVPEERDKMLYARASELYSVDLVDSPAANPSGLFEGGPEINPIHRNKMIDQIKELLGFAAKTNESLSALQAEVAKVVSLEAKNKELSDALAAKSAECAEIQAKLDAANKAAVSTEELASKKAIEITAAQGVPPVQAGAPNASGKDLLEQLESIVDSNERTAFFRKHRNELLALRRARK